MASSVRCVRVLRELMGDFNSEVTVVIPTLNEAEAIGRVIDELKCYGVENIIVVDGGSTDGTVEIARSKGVKVLTQEGRGKALAIKTALKHVNTKYILVMDGDYTYPAKHVVDLYMKAREGYDEVIGARKQTSKTQKLIFRLGNTILTKLFNLLFGTNLSDVLSGMYIVRRDRLVDALFETKGFSIESEIAAHIASTTMRITEVPIEYRRRLGKKKLKVIHGIAIAKDIVRLAWRYNPVFTIFITGAILLIPGLTLGLWVAYHYLMLGVKYYVKGLIALMMTLTGLQSLLIAILALYLKRMEYRINRKLIELKEGEH